MIDSDDPSMTVAKALAEEICPGCIYRGQKAVFRSCREKAICPFFHPDNFYYDADFKRFWCHNWLDAQGNRTPSGPAERKSVSGEKPIANDKRIAKLL